MSRFTAVLSILACSWLSSAFTTTNILPTVPVQTPKLSRNSVRETVLSAASSATDGTSESTEQNVFGETSDAFTGILFSLLHAFDPDPIGDSSKNLRVLWARALLNTLGMIEDDVASTFLPPTTRGIVNTKEGAKLFTPIVQFTEWIQARTDFIDGGLNHFLTSPLCKSEDDGEPMPCNAILIGAGYDTRALRFRNKHGGKIKFFEMDLPDVCDGKQTLYDKFKKEQDPSLSQSTLIPLDLNVFDDPNVDFMKRLEEAGMDTSLPTFLCFEAVLFYVNENAINNLMSSIFKYAENPKNAELMLCMTDSLKPAVDVPFTNAARNFFDNNGMELLEHRSRWGGAVHFALAGSRRYSFESEKKKLETGVLGTHVHSRVPQLVNSYTPTQSNNKDLIKNPSFDNVWYAVAYPWQIDGFETPLDAAMAGYNKERTSNAADKKTLRDKVVGRTTCHLS
jgi:methyltransferase (TIGR00027 family)